MDQPGHRTVSKSDDIGVADSTKSHSQSTFQKTTSGSIREQLREEENPNPNEAGRGSASNRQSVKMLPATPSSFIDNTSTQNYYNTQALYKIMKNRRSFSLLFFVALQGIATAFAPPAGKNSSPAPRQRSKNNHNMGGPSWGILVNNHHRLAASGGSRSNNNDNEWGIPHHSELVPLSQSAQPVPVLPNGGRLTLLGAGPGDPDLLTVAAYRLLTTTSTTTAQRKGGTGGTVIIADRLVAPEILNLIDQRNCEVKVARKLPGCAELAQEEIYWWIYQGLRDGKHVIRLKIGDPFVFGRGGEEVLTCRTFGVEAKIIPVRLFRRRVEVLPFCLFRECC
jgi:hypothetical protein